MVFFRAFNKKEIKDFEKDAESKVKITDTVKNIIDNRKITKEDILKQTGFIFLIFFFGIIYIANRFNAERLARDTVKLKKQRSELRAEHIATASELMFMSKQSEIIELIDSFKIGLIESTEPPIKVKVDTED